MKKKKMFLDGNYQEKVIPLSFIQTDSQITDFDKKELKAKAAYILTSGAPVFTVNTQEDGKFTLLSSPEDYFACALAEVREVKARVYAFTPYQAEIFGIVQKIKTQKLSALEEGYLMRSLQEEYHFTQEDIAAMLSKSRPAVANTLRLLTLEPEVIGLIESGQLSAGHARALVKVEKEKQYAFASECIKREYSVREMERAVKAYLTPPEILEQEKQAKNAEKNRMLKAFVERMRHTFQTKVSLIGNDKKGRIYIDYYSTEDLFRFEEFLDIIENSGLSR
jgi:ParB family chromosome partitioning protein